MVHYQRIKIGTWKDEEEEQKNFLLVQRWKSKEKNPRAFSLSVVLMNENYQDKEVSSFVWLLLCNLLDVRIETK